MKQSFLGSSRDCLVVGTAFVIGFFVSGAARLSGLLFVAFLDRYHVGREKASIPFVVSYAMRNLFSPITGYLGTKFDPRSIVLAGCFFAATGVCVCFFAEEFVVVIISWGAVYGLGYGTECALVPKIISEHFQQHFDKANGLYLCSNSIAGIILPVLENYSIKKYGVSGSFLILSSALLHTIPAAMILAAVTTRQRTSVKYEVQRTLSYGIAEKRTDITEDKFISAEVSKENVDNGSCHLKNPFEKTRSSKKENDGITECYRLSECRSKISNNEILSPKVSGGKGFSPLEQTEKSGQFRKCVLFSEKNIQEPNVNRNIKKVETSSATLPEGRKRALQSFGLFLDPTFILMLLTQGVTSYVNATVWTVVVDAARDHGVEEHNELHILEALNCFDFLGRILLGHITGSGYISKTNFLSLCLVCLAVTCPIFAYLEGFAFVMVAVSVFGLLLGLSVVGGLGIVQQYIEEENSSMGFSAVYSLYGLTSFTQPLLIGFFRENLQSYNGLFYLMGTMCFISSMLNLFIPSAARYRDKKKQTTENNFAI